MNCPLDRSSVESQLLEIEFLSLPFPTAQELGYLRQTNIDPGSPLPLRIIETEEVAGGRFRATRNGVVRIVCPVICGGAWIDLAAFGSQPGPVLTAFGTGWVLGWDCLTDLVPAGPVRVFRHPTDWLRSGGAGAVFLSFAEARRHLAEFEHAELRADDLEHVQMLRDELRPRPPRLPRITRADRHRDSRREVAA